MQISFWRVNLGRLIHSSQTDGTNILQRTEHLYDTSNRISSQSWQLGDRVYTESYTYDEDDGSLKSMQPAVGGAMAFEYDGLKRLSSLSNGVYRKSYTYRDITTGTRTTTQVASLAYAPDGSAMSGFSLAYAYDQRGNITGVEGTGITGHNAQYAYDIPGQLTRETVNGVTYNYAYDTYGNIRSVSGGESHTYTYGNEEWRDLLTAYDGHSISYDEIGNPETYYNGTDWTFDWEKGRQLTSVESDEITAAYAYDLNGIRTSKTVNGVTYNFLTQNGKVVRQTWGGNFMDFIYDNTGRPYAIVNGNATSASIYYYVLNQQGDVIRILGPNNTVAATYTYNAWGEVISSSGWMANQNPLRYRGYFQDNETGFYYLQSRYYDPSIGRFINADEYASTGQGFLGYNMFTYCANNPITYIDESGDRIRLTDAGTGRKSPYTKNVSTKTAKKKPVKVGKVILEAIEKPSKNGGTFSVSPSFSGSSYGMGVGKSACLSVDTGYNYVIQSTTSTSPPSSPGASAGLTFTFTDAMNVSDLEGMSFSRGVTLVAKYGISIDYVTFEPASNPGTTNHGIAVTIGVGADVGFQAAENYTVTHGSWNPITAIKNAVYGG